MSLDPWKVRMIRWVKDWNEINTTGNERWVSKEVGEDFGEGSKPSSGTKLLLSSTLMLLVWGGVLGAWQIHDLCGNRNSFYNMYSGKQCKYLFVGTSCFIYCVCVCVLLYILCVCVCPVMSCDLLLLEPCYGLGEMTQSDGCVLSLSTAHGSASEWNMQTELQSGRAAMNL